MRVLSSGRTRKLTSSYSWKGCVSSRVMSRSWNLLSSLFSSHLIPFSAMSCCVISCHHVLCVMSCHLTSCLTSHVVEGPCLNVEGLFSAWQLCTSAAILRASTTSVPPHLARYRALGIVNIFIECSSFRASRLPEEHEAERFYMWDSDEAGDRLSGR